MDNRWLRVLLAALGVVAVVAATWAVAATGAGDDAAAQSLRGQEQPADPDDYEIEVTACTRADDGQGGASQGALATRTATGTITNTAEETRSFKVPAHFLGRDGVRLDRVLTIVEELAPDQTAQWTAVSYAEDAKRSKVTCDVGEVTYVPSGARFPADRARFGPLVPDIVYVTRDNTDEGGGGPGGGGGDVGDIDAVTYVCYLVNVNVPVTCGNVSN